MKYNLNKLLLAIVGLLLSTTTLAQNFVVDGIYYNITNTTAKTVGVTKALEKYTGAVTIPSSVTYNGTTYSVTSIGFEAFSWCDGLTSVTIPNSVTSIGDNAFYNCDGLTSVTIPNSVTSIGYYAFAYCSGLISITIPNSVTKIGERAFYDCTGLTLVTIGNSVTEIGDEAFSWCDGLTEVNYNAENCTSMGSSNYPVFKGCSNLKTLNIGNEVKYIPPYAFKGCDGLTLVNYNAENCTSMGSSSYPVFSGCSNLKTLNIGNEVKYIPSYAFEGCTGLTSITIPNSVTSIGTFAFGGCTGLTLITIPNSVTSIGTSAFSGCDGLTLITIPNSVTEIGYHAFYGTGWYYNQPNGILYLDNCCLGYKGDEPTGSLSLKDDTRLIGNEAFAYCSGLTSVTIPNSVTKIGERAFYDCTGLTLVTIGNSVTEIGDEAFSWCDDLTEVNISDLSSWCKIDFHNERSNPLYYAQMLKLNGSEITNLVIPNDITQIKQYAFFYCNGLTSVTIPNSVTSIGKSAFYYCPSLTSVTIPNSVTKIDYLAFRNCDLRLIMSHCAIPPTCDGVVFGVNGNDNYSALLMIPEGSLIDYALADEWHKFTQVHEVSEATVSTQEKNATFEIPTIEGATKYDVTVYSDITMTQLVATTHYDAYGKITPMSTSLKLSIDGFDDGVYYYKVLVKSAEGEILKNYIGTFEIYAAGVENIATDDAVEVSRYDIHGRLLNEPTRGVNIVIYSDGSTRKEIIKE